MPEKKMKNIKREMIEQKLNLVVEKLMNLGGPENEEELKDGGEAIGFFKRDFGDCRVGTAAGSWTVRPFEDDENTGK